MPQIRIGLIATGYMGKAHAIAFHGLRAVFAPPLPVICEMLAEIGDEHAWAMKPQAELWQPKELEQELEQ